MRLKIKNQKLTRQLEEAQFSQQNNELVFSIASETPYLRTTQLGQYYEILKCQPQYVDVSRLKDDIAPFLLDHQWNKQIGVVHKFWFANKKLYVSIKFSKSSFAQGIKRDIIDQVRRNVSVGYIINDYKIVEPIDEIKTIEVTSWQPYQASSVSVPADYSVGYKRSLNDSNQKGLDMKNEQTNKTDSTSELDKQELEVEKEKTDLELENKNLAIEDGTENSEVAEEKTKEAEVEETEVKSEVCPECGKNPCECEKADDTVVDDTQEEKACGGKPQEKDLSQELLKAKIDKINLQTELIKDKQRVLDITALGEMTNNQEAAKTFIAEKKSVDEFKNYLKNLNLKKEDTHMEKKYFSISKAIRNACSQYKKDVSEEYETQVIAENKRALKVEDADIVLTNAQLHQRSFPSGTIGPSAGVGAELINTDYLPQEFVTYLRPQLTLEKTGYYSIPVNGNAVSFAVCTSGATAAMYDLDGELADGDMKFSLKTLTPKKAGVCIPVPYSLILEGRPEVDAMVEADVVNALYQKRDEQILVGDGANGACTGIINTTGINALTASLSGFGAWKACLSGVNEIRKKNIFSENISFVMNGDTYVDLCTTPKNKDNCMAGFVIENDKIGNYPVYVNNAITGNVILVGDFGEVAVADFQGLKLKVDDITYIKQGAIQVVATKAFDLAVRRLGAFTKITLED